MEPVHLGEFNRAIDRLSQQVDEGNQTNREILVEAEKTNGRVYAVERLTAELTLKLATLEKRVDETAPLTKRDLWVAMGTLGAAAAAVKWMPVLFALGQGAP